MKGMENMNQNGSSRLDAALKMLLIAFVSLIAFSTGVYMGKRMSDNDYQVKSLEADFKESHLASDEKAEKRPEDALVDEDVTALSEKLVNAEKEKTEGRSVASQNAKEESPAQAENKAPEAKVASTEKTPAKVATPKKAARTVIAEASKAADRVAQGDSPMPEHVTTAAKAQPRVPSSLPRSVGTAMTGEYTVQVASYPEESEAKAQAEALNDKGFAAYPWAATVKGKTWYRVGVGSFKSPKDASAYRTQLLHQADFKSAIVQKIEK